MKNIEKKKTILERLFGSKKEKGGCCNIELEEIVEEKDDNSNSDNVANKENDSCCS